MCMNYKLCDRKRLIARFLLSPRIPFFLNHANRLTSVIKHQKQHSLEHECSLIMVNCTQEDLFVLKKTEAASGK